MKFYLLDTIIDGNEGSFLSLVEPASKIKVPWNSVIGKVEKDSTGGIAKLQDNPEFLKVLHSCIKTNAQFCEGILQQAKKQNDGLIYIIDRRVGDIFGYIPPDDLVGIFQVSEGAVQVETYKPNPNYKLFSAKGLFQLDEFFERRLLQTFLGCATKRGLRELFFGLFQKPRIKL